MVFARTIVVALVILAAYGYGVYSHKHKTFPMQQIKSVNMWIKGVDLSEPGQTNTSNRIEVDCAVIGPDTPIILTMGQSNAANNGNTEFDRKVGVWRNTFKPVSGVLNFNFLDGNCYEALDPLLGATGVGGSVWIRLGDILRKTERYKQVLFVPLAVGGSYIAEWTPDGQHGQRIAKAVGKLRAKGLKVSHIFWHQGESEAIDGISERDYIADFSKLWAEIRRNDISAPIYVAVASLCRNTDSEAIRSAQKKIPGLFDGVFPGPDTDTINTVRLRHDGCHFSVEGLMAHAHLWHEAVWKNEAE